MFIRESWVTWNPRPQDETISAGLCLLCQVKWALKHSIVWGLVPFKMFREILEGLPEPRTSETSVQTPGFLLYIFNWMFHGTLEITRLRISSGPSATDFFPGFSSLGEWHHHPRSCLSRHSRVILDPSSPTHPQHFVGQLGLHSSQNHHLLLLTTLPLFQDSSFLSVGLWQPVVLTGHLVLHLVFLHPILQMAARVTFLL